MSEAALLQARGLTVRIADKYVCHDFDLTLQPGTRLGLLGGNGVGKTTLLNTLAGLREPDNGEILLDGQSLRMLPRRRIAQRLGLLIQQQEDSLPASVLETALIGRHPHIDFWRWESHVDVNIARRALRLVGLDGLEQRPQTQLSGGERRRLAIATILTQDPRVFLLDEPANQLDLHHQLALLDHFATLVCDQSRALIMALHDVNMAARFCNQILMLFGNDEILYGNTTEILTAENLSRLYHTPLTPVRWPGGTIYVPG
ncbi:MAG: ABC transporter ATP-binding protein [Gammaproteobacteria bacterium]